MDREQALATIKDDVSNNDVFLFMKGTPESPMCGFSAQVVQILNQIGVSYQSRNVLDEWEIREGVKEYSDWSTIPQLYVKGEFVGGCDIVMEMQRRGELAGLFNN